jgi:hypothetical protein
VGRRTRADRSRSQLRAARATIEQTQPISAAIMQFVYLAIAILAEVVGTTALEASNG